MHLQVSKIFVKLTHRIKYHAVEKKRDELKERNKALKDKVPFAASLVSCLLLTDVKYSAKIHGIASNIQRERERERD